MMVLGLEVVVCWDFDVIVLLIYCMVCGWYVVLDVMY